MAVGPVHRQGPLVPDLAWRDQREGDEMDVISSGVVVAIHGREQRLEQACPRLSERGHGSWYFHCSVSMLSGTAGAVRRGGFPSRTPPWRSGWCCVAGSREECTTATWTVARGWRLWLTTRSSIRPSTLRSYTEHVDNHLIPHLGSTRRGS